MFEGWGCNSDSLYVKPYLYNTATNWKGQDFGLNNANFTTDKWFHLVYSYNENDSKMSLYSNGAFVADSERFADSVQADGTQPGLGKLKLDPAMKNLYIGAWHNNTDGTHADAWRSSFSGSVDEIRIWNVALTPEEIEDLYTKEVVKADGIQ
jgi:transcription elongation factor